MYQAGLVLEGGGMKGVYTAGVLDFFTEKGIDFSHIYGVSAGACHMCSYLSRQKGRALSVSVDYLDTRRYCSLESLLTSGDLFNVDFCYHLIPEYLYPYDYETFEKYPGKAYSVVTNIETGQPEYLRVRDIRKDIDKIRASASLPLVARNVKIDGKLYLDGGVADSVPFKAAERLGFDRVAVILTRDKSYVKKPMNPKPIELCYKHYPAFMEQLKERHSVYNNSLKELLNWEQQGKAWVLHPSHPIEIGRLERHAEKLQAVYDLGTGDAQTALDSLQAFLAQN